MYGKERLGIGEDLASRFYSMRTKALKRKATDCLRQAQALRSDRQQVATGGFEAVRGRIP